MPAFDFWLQHGDVVRLLDDRLGTIKFIGVLDNQALPNVKRPCVSYGLELDAPFEDGNNGSLDGIRYFNAEEKCGLFVRRRQIKENVHAQFRPGQRLKKWSRKVQRVEKHVDREVHISSPVSIQPSVSSPSGIINQNQSKPNKVDAKKREPVDLGLYDDSSGLRSEPISMSLPAEEACLNTSKADEVVIQSVDLIDVSPSNNPPLNRSKPTEVYVESEQPSGMNSDSVWNNELSVLPGQNIQPGIVSLERPSTLVVQNVQPSDINLERPSEMVVHNFPSNDAIKTDGPDLFTQCKSIEVSVDSKVSREERPVYNEQLSLSLSEPAEVQTVTIQPFDMGMLDDKGSVEDSKSTELFDIQPNEATLNIAPIPLNHSESAEVVVHNIEPNNLSPSEQQICLDRSKPTDVFVGDVVSNNDVKPYDALLDSMRSQQNEVFVEDVAPTTHEQRLQLSSKQNIRPSLISINIIPAANGDDSIFGQGAEEDGKVEEEEIPSNEAVFERMLKLLGEGFGSNVDENVIKEKVSKLLRNLGNSTKNPTSDKNHPTSDDDVSEFSDTEGHGDYNALEATVDESSETTDFGYLNANTIRFDPFGQAEEDEESEEGIFTGNTQYDENLLENMGMVKFEKMQYSTLRHHSHQLSQNYVNLPSFSSVIKENTRKRSGMGSQSNLMANPQSRRIASEPINVPNNSNMDVKSPEAEDILYEDEQKQNTRESHNIDNKAKRLDSIDEQIKVIGEELTELTNKSFQVLLEMGQANDEDSQTLEKEYLKIEMKSQQLRQKKSSLDMERQDLVDSVQNMMFASFDIMSPSDDHLSGLSGLFDMGAPMPAYGDTEMFTSPPL